MKNFKNENFKKGGKLSSDFPKASINNFCEILKTSEYSSRFG